jgi:hypothetical protein
MSVKIIDLKKFQSPTLNKKISSISIKIVNTWDCWKIKNGPKYQLKYSVWWKFTTPVTANTSIYSSLSMVQGESHLEVSTPIIPSGFTPPPNQEEAAIV